MTGFGRGVVEHAGVRATVDIRAVNHRFLDLKLRGVALPPAMEEAVSTKVRASVERGSVAVSIHVTRHGAAAATSIDTLAAAQAHQTLTQLATTLGLAPPDLALVLAQPGVVVTADRAEEEHPPVLEAVDAALAQLDQMRRTEGDALAAELFSRFEELATLRTQVAMVAATVPQQLSRRLDERVRRLLSTQEGAEVDPARLAQEIALLADRADITEELVRLASHLDQARTLIAATGSATRHGADGAAPRGGVGRRLDFLVQEIGRELNTVGSKSTVTEISTAIVDAKAVLEKVREQVQNVE